MAKRFSCSEQTTGNGEQQPGKECDMSDTEQIWFGTQIRRSPFFEAVQRWGARSFSVYNHMYIPRDFGDPVQNYWNLVENAILCDVAVERWHRCDVLTGRPAAGRRARGTRANGSGLLQSGTISAPRLF